MIVKKKTKGKGKGTGKKKAVKAGPKFDYRPPTMPPPLPEVISIRSVCFYRFGFFCIGFFPDGLEHSCFLGGGHLSFRVLLNGAWSRFLWLLVILLVVCVFFFVDSRLFLTRGRAGFARLFGVGKLGKASRRKKKKKKYCLFVMERSSASETPTAPILSGTFTQPHIFLFTIVYDHVYIS
jgi:hypothetical protein